MKVYDAKNFEDGRCQAGTWWHWDRILLCFEFSCCYPVSWELSAIRVKNGLSLVGPVRFLRAIAPTQITSDRWSRCT
jgi:hypothetical protein